MITILIVNAYETAHISTRKNHFRLVEYDKQDRVVIGNHEPRKRIRHLGCKNLQILKIYTFLQGDISIITQLIVKKGTTLHFQKLYKCNVVVVLYLYDIKSIVLAL